MERTTPPPGPPGPSGDRRRGARRTALPADVVGLHLADDTVTAVRLRCSAPGRVDRLTSLVLPLPAGAVVAGVVRDRDRTAGVLAPVRRFAEGAPVRVVVGSLDVAAVPLPTAGAADPLAPVLARVAELAIAGDVVSADVVSVYGQATGLAGALRSSLVRLSDALGTARVVASSLDALPVALVAAATALVPVPTTAWTVRADGGRLRWLASVSRTGRIQGGAVWLDHAIEHAVVEVAAATSAVAPVDLAAALVTGVPGAASARDHAAALVPAFGAALGGISQVVAGPDLRVAAVHRPLEGGDDEALPRWAVEHVGPLAALDAACGRRGRLRRGRSS